jgi:ACS family sodium-dependent inorganic phosphate cotransporter
MGTLLAVATTPFIILAFGWQAVFYLFGATGFVWFLFWWPLAGDRPSRPLDPDITSLAEESGSDQKREKKAIPWRTILGKREVWAIIIAHFSNNWGLYVLLAWLPSYFSSQLGVNLREVWVYISLPWVAMFVVGNGAGWLADRMIDSGRSVTFVRKAMQIVGSGVPAIALLLLAGTQSALVAVTLLTLALGFGAFSFAGFASNHLDISPRHAGVIFGISNTAGTLPGIIGVALTGMLVDATGTYATAFYVTAGIYFAGLLVYLAFGTGRKII